MVSFLVVRIVFSEIGVHPDLDSAGFGDEDHFLDDIKVANFFVEKFESIKCGFVHVKKILEWNVVNLLESQLNLICV
jgi:hypothetical protein